MYGRARLSVKLETSATARWKAVSREGLRSRPTTGDSMEKDLARKTMASCSDLGEPNKKGDLGQGVAGKGSAGGV